MYEASDRHRHKGTKKKDDRHNPIEEPNLADKILDPPPNKPPYYGDPKGPDGPNDKGHGQKKK
jgi:hypothetical protein